MDISFDGWGLAPSRQFLRNWTLGDGQEAGAWGRDEIRNISGRFAFQTGNYDSAYLSPVAQAHEISGVFAPSGAVNKAATAQAYLGNTGPGYRIDMNVSRQVPTGAQNVPQHIWQPVIIYLGRPK